MGEGNVAPSLDPRNRPLTDSEIIASRLEIEAITVAESPAKDYQKALLLLTEAIAKAPNYPSPFNNRAQVYRLLTDHGCALADLEIALEQCGNDFPLVKRQALCQRAWIRHAAGHREEAFADFDAAGKLGCEEARKMAVACNPYAKLCNSIMQEMLDKLYYSKPIE